MLQQQERILFWFAERTFRCGFAERTFRCGFAERTFRCDGAAERRGEGGAAGLGCCTNTWTRAVQVVSFSEARESFKAVLDRVEADADVTVITRRNAQSAVVMSLDTYNSLMETVHLLRTPANAAHLQRSLEQAERGELLEQGLIDADA